MKLLGYFLKIKLSKTHCAVCQQLKTRTKYDSGRWEPFSRVATRKTCLRENCVDQIMEAAHHMSAIKRSKWFYSKPDFIEIFYLGMRINPTKQTGV